MPSRLWLAAAFVLAFGPSPSRAETDLIAVTLDQAKIAKLPAGATTLIIGNPMIADVTMLKNNNSMVITGKGFGQTNLIAIDAGGSIIEEKQVRVLPAKTVLVLQNGSSRISYACNPQCMPTVQLGDDDKIVLGSGRIRSRPATATLQARRERPRSSRQAAPGSKPNQPRRSRRRADIADGGPRLRSLASRSSPFGLEGGADGVDRALP